MDCDIVSTRFNTVRARASQELLKNLVIIEDLYGDVRFIAGLDASYTKGPGGIYGIGVAVLLDSHTMSTIACRVYVSRICIPYIPGLLAFREMAVMAPALSSLIEEHRVDLVIVDGHGIAHPRGFGIASHVGVAFMIPSIGVAKKRLYGELKLVDGDLYIINGDRILGVVLGSGRGRIYVSPGNMVSVRSSARIVKMLLRDRLPEPTRIADHVTKAVKRMGVLAEGLMDCPAKTGGTSLLNYI